MNWKRLCQIVMVLGFVVMPVLVGAENLSPEYQTSLGGRLYDNWISVLKLKKPPKKTHPAYPASGKAKGSATWRCSKCHGWDYQGKESGIAKNLLTWQGRDPADMVGVIRNSVPDYWPHPLE